SVLLTRRTPTMMSAAIAMGRLSSVVVIRTAVDKHSTSLRFSPQGGRGPMPNYTNSVWSETTPAPPYAPLAGNVAVDVAVVGGGITGITAGLLLARAGRRVAVVEARRIGKGESGKTTAHLTEALDQPYHVLIARFGLAGARLAADGQRAAIERIAAFTDECAIPCDLQRVAGFGYAETRA